VKLAFVIGALGTFLCFHFGAPWLSAVPLYFAFAVAFVSNRKAQGKPYREWESVNAGPGSLAEAHTGHSTLSPDTTFAEEGDFKDIPIAAADRIWRLDYEDVHGEDTTRDITLRALREKRDHYYLLAFCHTRKSMRSFRLDRILSATDLITGEVFGGGAVLLRYLTTQSAELSQFQGKRIAVYGPLATIEISDVRKRIELLGGISCGGHMIRNLDFVIAGEHCNKNKLAQAQKGGAKVLSEYEWRVMIENGNTVTQKAG
jgi:hypothetical protein